MGDIAERSRHLVAEFLKRQGAGDGVGMANPLSIGAAFFEMTARMISDPSRLVQAQLSLWNDYMTLWQRTAQRFLGGATEPMIEPPAGDRRFRDKAWTDNTLFDFINIVPRDNDRGYKVHFHKDRTLNGMTVVSIIFEGNERFLLRALDWLAADDAGLSLPPRPAGPARLVLGAREVRLAGWLALLVLPGLTATIGAILFFRRRRRA